MTLTGYEIRIARTDALVATFDNRPAAMRWIDKNANRYGPLVLDEVMTSRRQLWCTPMRGAVVTPIGRRA